MKACLLKGFAIKQWFNYDDISVLSQNLRPDRTGPPDVSRLPHSLLPPSCSSNRCGWRTVDRSPLPFWVWPHKEFKKKVDVPNELWRYENIWGNISLIIPDPGNVLLASEKYSLTKQLCSLSYLSLLIQRDFEITLVMYFHRWNSLKRKINILKEWYYQSNTWMIYWKLS